MTKRNEKEILKNVKNGDVIGYDIGNGDRFSIVANVEYEYQTELDGDDEMWFGCDEYDCVYDLSDLLDKSIVELVV